MHERNRYRTAPVNFAALAREYPDFARYVRRKRGGADDDDDDDNAIVRVVWTDSNAVLELTKALLHRYVRASCPKQQMP